LVEQVKQAPVNQLQAMIERRVKATRELVLMTTQQFGSAVTPVRWEQMLTASQRPG
jgi:hypothetical protein